MIGKIYDWINKDSEGAVCKDITDEACGVVPENFGRLFLTMVLTKTGDALSKPGLILTWLLSALGANSFFIGLLVPIREAGSLLPQMIVGGAIRKHTIRKGFWLVGGILQGLAVIGMAISALLFKGTTAGWIIVSLLAIFSLSRGICSIASKDLVGKTIPKTRRGRLSGLASSVSGWIAVGVGLFFAFNRAENFPLSLFAILLFAAGATWLIASGIMATLDEKPGPASGEGNAFQKAWKSFRYLREDRQFRRFCIARALLASTVLSMPFYVVIAREATGGKIASLGILMVAGSIATAVSGFAWGKIADKSSRLTLGIAGLSAGLVGCLTAWLATLKFNADISIWIFGALFFLIGLAHTGIRVGRKTYLVDMATAENRAALVALSNTLMGIVLLLSGSFGLLANALGNEMIILVFAILGIIGSLMAFTLPDVQEG